MKRSEHPLVGWLRRGLWADELTDLPVWKGMPLRLVRSIVLSGKRMAEHRLPIRAQALTYVTVLSLVPLLAFAFAVAKGFGLYDKLVREVVEPFLLRNFGPSEGTVTIVEGVEEPLEPTQLRVAIDSVLEIVEGTDVKSLGLVGLVVLAYAAIRLLTQVEVALNLIWGVRRPRRFLRRVTDYLAILVVGPVLALAATAVKASSQSQGAIEWVRSKLHLGPVLDLVFALGPLFTMWVMFALLYLVMPNTRVRWFSAVLGGFVAAVMWSLVQEVYVEAQIGVSGYSQVYATFAAIPLFLFWVYLSWLSVLVGAQFGQADQAQCAYRRQALSRSADQAFFETAILSGVGRIAERFEAGEPPLTVDELLDELEIPRERLVDGFERLEEAGLLARTGDDGELGFVLARSPDRVRVAELLLALRGRVPEQVVPAERPLDEALRRSARELEEALTRAESNRDLRGLVRRGGTENGTPAADGNGIA